MGGVVGVVTEADFLVKEGGHDAIRHRRFGWLLGESGESRAQQAKLAATSAGEAMTGPPVTVEPGRSISEAARLMTQHRVNRLPVVEDGRLVGIVTRADVVRVYVRTDAELAEAVRHDVLRGILWLDPDRFSVEVHDGRVSISGRVERRSTAEMVERHVRTTPGVVDVDADIAWTTDDEDIEPTTTDPVVPFSPR